MWRGIFVENKWEIFRFTINLNCITLKKFTTFRLKIVKAWQPIFEGSNFFVNNKNKMCRIKSFNNAICFSKHLFLFIIIIFFTNNLFSLCIMHKHFSSPSIHDVVDKHPMIHWNMSKKADHYQPWSLLQALATK